MLVQGFERADLDAVGLVAQWRVQVVELDRGTGELGAHRKVPLWPWQVQWRACLQRPATGDQDAEASVEWTGWAVGGQCERDVVIAESLELRLPRLHCGGADFLEGDEVHRSVLECACLIGDAANTARDIPGQHDRHNRARWQRAVGGSSGCA
jgi:hypothetical protein